MKAARLAILLGALASAGGAGYVALNMAKAPPVSVVQAQPSEPQIKLEDVLVASENLPVGTEILGQLTWQSWPQSTVNEGFITRTSRPDATEMLKGSTVRLQIFKGEPVREAKLIGAGQSFMSSILPSGMRAVGVQVAADTSAGGFILPNDYVDVIMTRRNTDTANLSGNAYLTETILSNVRVLAIDQTIQEDEEGRKVKVGQTATLELTPEQAEIITVGQQMADRLSLALRSTQDAQEVVSAGADHLVNSPSRRSTVKLIKSGTITEVGAR